MPEGDTIFRTARTLNRALAGRVVTRFESPLPALMRVDQDQPIAGRTIRDVRSVGKHLLIESTGEVESPVAAAEHRSPCASRANRRASPTGARSARNSR